MRGFGWMVVMLGVLLPGCWAQSKQELSASLLHKTLFLRGLWENDTLSFDADGHLQGPSPTSTPLAAGVKITRVQVKKDKLLLTGERLSARFEDGHLLAEPMGKTVRMEIAAPATANYDSALQTVFSSTLTGLAPDIPAYWQACLAGALPDAPADSQVLQKPIAGAQPPVLLFAPQLPPPTEPVELRSLHFVMRVGFTVDRCGTPTGVVVVRGSATSLDQQAVEVVRRYRFKPAMREGQPIAVPVQIEFALYIP